MVKIRRSSEARAFNVNTELKAEKPRDIRGWLMMGETMNGAKQAKPSKQRMTERGGKKGKIEKKKEIGERKGTWQRGNRNGKGKRKEKEKEQGQEGQ